MSDLDNESLDNGSESAGEQGLEGNLQAEDSGQQNDTASSAQEGKIDEPLVPQSKVNKLLGHKMREAEERAYRRFQEQHQQNQIATQNQQSSKKLDFSNMTESEFTGLVRQASVQETEMQKINDFSVSFGEKLRNAGENDPDFNSLIDDLELTKVPRLAYIANDFDNTADVLADLARNPKNYTEIVSLLNVGNERMAKKELKKLSDSIKQNNSAKGQKKAPDPLTQLKPSNLKAGGNSDDFAALRKLYRR